MGNQQALYGRQNPTAKPVAATPQQMRAAVAQQMALFKGASLSQTDRLNDVAFNAFGQTLNLQVKNTGYLTGIWVRAQGTITTGASASGNWSDFAPYNIFGRINVSNANGFNTLDIDGMYNPWITELYQKTGTHRLVSTPTTPGVTTTKGASTGIYIFPTLQGAIAASTTYKVNIFYFIPFCLDYTNSVGMINVSSNSVIVQTRITLCQASDLLAPGGSLGTSPSIALTVKSVQEYYAIPAPAPDGSSLQPPLLYLLENQQTTVPWTASGRQEFRPVTGGVIVRILARFVNAGLVQPFFATASDPSTANFTDMEWRYSGSNTPARYDMQYMLMNYRKDYGRDLEDGRFIWDFANGGGYIDMGVSNSDTVDTSQLTELLTAVTTSVTPGAGSTIEYLVQKLLPVSRAA